MLLNHDVLCSESVRKLINISVVLSFEKELKSSFAIQNHLDQGDAFQLNHCVRDSEVLLLCKCVQSIKDDSYSIQFKEVKKPHIVHRSDSLLGCHVRFARRMILDELN